MSLIANEKCEDTLIVFANYNLQGQWAMQYPHEGITL
jgi:hypothetical protein